MNSITTREFEGSQPGAALTAGNRATLTNLKELRNQIGLIRDIASQYCTLTVRDKNSRVFFVYYFIKVMESANTMLPDYVEGVIQGQYVEPLCIATGQYREDEFWTWCNKICIDMSDQNLYGRLTDNINRLKDLLEDAENAIMHCKPELFEEFFFNEKQNYSYDGVKKRFDDWMYDNMCPDIEKLRELQALVVADALKLGVMNFAPDPSYQEIEEVKVDYLKKLLPWDYDMSGDFRNSCARWRKFFRWEGTILVINYKKYGKYIQRHYYDFNDTQLQAIFELDMMLLLIHKEMQKLIEAEQPTPSVMIDHNPDEEPFKFIHPSISGDEVWQIHEEVKRLVKHQKIPEICAYLKDLKQKGKVLLPSSPTVMYDELVRLGMPKGKGFTEKHFGNYYMK